MNPKLSPEQLAQQLKNPKGALGKKIAERMNQSNKAITEFTYSLMPLHPNKKVLEIGFGNGKLLPLLLDKEPKLNIAGIDISETMVEEASQFNNKFIAKKQMDLKVASVSKIPFPNKHFDVVCSINTIYFWKKPEKDFQELFRVMKKDGSLFISITPKSEMLSLPTTPFGFRLYEDAEIEDLVYKTSFSAIKKHQKAEPPIVFDGEQKTFHSLVFEIRK